MSELLSVQEASKQFDITTDRIYQWIHRGWLPEIRSPRLVVKLEDITAIVEKYVLEPKRKKALEKMRTEEKNTVPPGMVSIYDAAQKTNIKENTLRRWAQDGELPSVKKGVRAYVKLSDIWAIFDKGELRFLKLLSRAGIGLVRPEWAKEKTNESD